MKFKIRHAESIVGLFILLAIVLLLVILVMMGANQRWFARDYHFHSRFQSGAGIAPGTAISLKGFTVGKISKIVLNESNTVDAEFVIYDTYIDKVTKNSVLELTTSPIGLGGGLLFYPGKSAERLREHAYIPSMDFEDGRFIVAEGLADVPPHDDTITRLLASINPLVDNVNRTVTTLNDALKGDQRNATGRIIAGIGTTVQTANGTLVDVDRTVAVIRDELPGIVNRANTLLDSLKVISNNLEATSAAVRDPTGLVPKLLDPKGSLKTLLDDNGVLFAKIDSLLTETDQAIKNVQDMTGTLNSSMPEITSLIAEGKTTVLQAQDVLEGLKNNPLLRGGIPERKQQEAPRQDLRDGDF